MFTLGLLTGIITVKIGARVYRWHNRRVYRAWVRAEDERYRQERESKMERELNEGGHLHWMTTNDNVPRSLVEEVHGHLLWGDQRENLSALTDIIRNVLKREGITEWEDMSDVITIDSVEVHRDEFGSLLSGDMTVRLLLPEDDERRKSLVADIDWVYSEWEHNTYGDLGQSGLNMSYRVVSG